jgi:hypothetical protein
VCNGTVMLICLSVHVDGFGESVMSLINTFVGFYKNLNEKKKYFGETECNDICVLWHVKFIYWVM